MQRENEKGQREFTFRKWNPNKIDALWGSDTADNLMPSCPMFFIFWYLLEAYCFFREYNETVEYCIQGKMSFDEILDEYKERTNITIKTNVLRVVNYLISLIGFYLVISS